MKRMVPAAIAAAGVVLLTACSQPAPTIVQASADEAPIGITVSGTGRVTGTPDVLRATLGIEVRRSSVSEAVDEAARLADGLLRTLTDLGVAEEDIQTANYSIYPEYDYRDERPRIVGYIVSNLVSVRIRDLERAGEILDAATAAGGDAIRVNGISFSLEDNEGLLEAARTRAWEDARSKAEQLAGLAGVELGPPTSITETFGSTPPPIAFDVRAVAEEAAVSTPIVPGEAEVSVSIQVVFGIVP